MLKRGGDPGYGASKADDPPKVLAIICVSPRKSLTLPANEDLVERWA